MLKVNEKIFNVSYIVLVSSAIVTLFLILFRHFWKIGFFQNLLPTIKGKLFGYVAIYDVEPENEDLDRPLFDAAENRLH